MSHCCEVSRKGRRDYRIFTRPQDAIPAKACSLNLGQADVTHYVRVTPLRVKHGTTIRVVGRFAVDPSTVLAFGEGDPPRQVARWEKDGTLSALPAHFRHVRIETLSRGTETVVVEVWEDHPYNPGKGHWTRVDMADVEFEVEVI